MKVESIEAGLYEENCHILIDEESKDCGIIDPGGNAGNIKALIDSLKVTPKFILLTHGHEDHVGGVEEIASHYKIPFYISKNDEEAMANDSYVFGSIKKADGYLKEGDTIALGSHMIEVIETPGHTKGGLCFLVDNILFSGDTLFRGSVGRSDFYGGDGAELIMSIKNKLMCLDDDVIVYPGHGPYTSIAYERQMNPYLQ